MDIILGGCAIVRKAACYTSLFQEGSLAYVCKTASTRGRLEPVFIKEVRLVRKLGFVYPIYVDTFNWLHNEDSLCTQNEAVSLAVAYQEAVIANCQEQLLTCPTTTTKVFYPRGYRSPRRHRFDCRELYVWPNSGI